MARSDLREISVYIRKWLNAYDARKRYHRLWRNAYFHYRQRHTRRYENFAVETFSPWVFTITENITARAMNAIFASRPAIAFQGRSGTEDAILATQLTRLFEYLVDDNDYEFRPTLRRAIKDAVLFGTGWVGVTITNKITSFGPISKPRLIWIPVRQMYVSPYSRNLSDARYIFRRTIISKEELERLIRSRYLNVDIKKISFNGYPMGYWDAFDFVSEEERWDPPSEERIEILEYWSYDEHVVIVGREKIGRRVDLDPSLGYRNWPYTAIRFTEDPERFYGIGVGEILYNLQEDLNLLRMQRMHNSELANNKLFVAMEGLVNPQSIKSRPGGVIWVRDPAALQELPVRDISASAYQEEEFIKQDIQLATGEFDYSLGMQPQRSRERATTVMRLQQAALNRFNEFVTNLSSTAIVDIVRRTLLIIRSNGSPQWFQSVVGDDPTLFFSMSPDRIFDLSDIKAFGGSNVAAKDLKLNQMTQALPVLLQSPFVRQDVLLRRFLTLLEIDNPEELIRSEQEAFALMQQQQQTEQQQ